MKYRTALKRHMTVYVSIYLLPLYQWYAFHNYVCQLKTICPDNTQCSAGIARSFSYKYSQKTSHGPPMRERHGVSFMSSGSDPGVIATIVKVTIKLQNTEPCSNGTWVYMHEYMLCELYIPIHIAVMPIIMSLTTYVYQPKTMHSTNTLYRFQYALPLLRDHFFSPQILPTCIPWLAHEGEAWGVVHEFRVSPRCYCPYCNGVYNITRYWIAL